MKFVNIFSCAFLIQLAGAINLELFPHSSGQIHYDLACCFNRFERILRKREVEHRSVAIFLPESDSSGNSQLKNILIPKSLPKYPWSVEIWQLKKCLKNHECRRSIQFKNNYIFVQAKIKRPKCSLKSFVQFGGRKIRLISEVRRTFA